MLFNRNSWADRFNCDKVNGQYILSEKITILPPTTPDPVENALRARIPDEFPYGDLIIKWYRNDKNKGYNDVRVDQDANNMPESNWWVRNVNNVIDDINAFNTLKNEYDRKSMTVPVEFQFNNRNVSLRPNQFSQIKHYDAAKVFINALRNLIHGEAGTLDAGKFAFNQSDYQNIWLAGAGNNVMAWITREYESTNKFIYVFWQNPNMNTDYGKPNENSPYCTRQKEHWDYYSNTGRSKLLKNTPYFQVWFFNKPEGDFDYTPGNLSQPNVRQLLTACKGQGHQLLIAMDDTNFDLLSNHDEPICFDDIWDYGEEVESLDTQILSRYKPSQDDIVKHFLYGDTYLDLVLRKRFLSGDIVIPEGTTSIGENAFYGCKNITSVTIPNTVTNIEESAFSYCSGLTSVTIPDSVTSIGDNAFSGCTNLTTVRINTIIPEKMGDSIFSNCPNIRLAILPDSFDPENEYYNQINRDILEQLALPKTATIKYFKTNHPDDGLPLPPKEVKIV